MEIKEATSFSFKMALLWSLKAFFTSNHLVSTLQQKGISSATNVYLTINISYSHNEYFGPKQM